MEVWVEPATNRIKAIYSPGKYSGNVWQSRGYVAYDKVEPWMLPMEPPAPEPPKPTTLIGEDGKEYLIAAGGAVKPKPVAVPS